MADVIPQKAFANGSTCPPTKPGVLRIYSMRFCPFAQRTRLVLAHKKIPHETVNINLKSKPDWFLALNPLGQVPVLQIDDKIITESTATSDWLDDVYSPDSRLQPTEPYRRAQDRILMEYVGKMFSALAGVGSATPETLPEKIAEMEKHFRFYEDKLQARGAGPFFGGTGPAMVDLFIWSPFERVPTLALATKNPAAGLDEAKFPRLAAWVKSMTQLPAVRECAFDAETHLKFTSGYMAGSPDFDIGL